MSDEYENPRVEIIASNIAETAIEELTASGWKPEDDSPLKALAYAASFGQALTNVLVLDAAEAVFEGEVAASGRPRREAISATLVGTVTATDALPHTVPEGAVFVLTTPSGDVSLWDASEDCAITGGTSAAGALKLTAQVGGDVFNDLTGTLFLYQPVQPWFDSAVTASPSTGGVAEEGIVEYRDAGARYLRSRLPRPVIADDWEAFTLDAHPDIARVMVIERFDPTDTTDGPLGSTKALSVVVAPAKSDGSSVGADPKAAIAAIPRLSDVELYIVDPTVGTVNVTATVVRRPEFPALQTKAAAEQALRDWLDPAVWGGDAIGEQSSWKPERKVRIKEAEAVLVRPAEVHYVDPTVAVTLQVVGVDGSPQTTDRTLDGLAPLAKLGTVNVTVLDPS